MERKEAWNVDAQELRDWENNQWREVIELEKLAESHKEQAKEAKESAADIVAKIRVASLRLNTDQGELPLGVDGIVPEGEGGEPAAEA